MPSVTTLPSAPTRSSTGPLEGRVRAALLELIFADQAMSLTAAAVFSVVIAFVVQRGESRPVLWAWLGGMAAVLAVRYREARCFRRVAADRQDTPRWEVRLFVASAITAVFWGYMGWYGYAFGSALTRTALFMFVGGVIAASSRTLACHAASFLTYVILSGAPLIIRVLVNEGRSGWLVAAFAVLYIALMVLLGFSFRRTVAQSFRLQFENADLAARLQRDVGARAAAEKALRASEQQLQLTQYALDHAHDMVAVVDREGSVLYVNQGFCRHTKRTAEELSRRKLWEGVVASDEEAYRRRWDEIRKRGALTFEAAILTASGGSTPVEVNASYIEFGGREAVCTVARDLSVRQAAEGEKLRLQQQLEETQRLESLGVLAGGVAHDFNNLLTAILGNASLARDSLADPKAAKDMLAQIDIAANQAAGLCRQMLAYAGHGQLRIEPLDVSTVVLESAKLLEMTIAHRARLELQLAPALPSILADESQLRQVVLNLVHNAAEAIERPNGAIVVTTATVHIDAALIASARVRRDVAPGPGVTLIVADNGSGMAPETLDRIFEPFFTTKFTGRGLGLPAVLGIVRSHRGLLHVQSERGNGSTFRVTFSASSVARPTPAARSPTGQPAANGRALVVEDEEAVRRVAQQTLLRLGYEVDTATDGASGIARVTRDPQRYALVVIDMTMPRMDGAVALKQMRKLGLSAPCILMSGLAEPQVRARLDGIEAVSFLPKPFDVSALTAAARAAVGAKP